MRKVTTINLNNNAYQVDEEGYDALRRYLDNAARALAGNPDREEILSDLEQAIADKCRMVLGQHKSVVSVAEIENILQEMGPVAGAADQPGTNSGTAEAQASASSRSADAASGYRPHRLYRIREGMMLAGVCQGFAAYAGIDVTLVRIAVVLVTILTAFVPCAFTYFVLWLVVPVAMTPAEMAAAQGQPFRAQEVVDRIKKKHGSFRAEHREKRRMRRASWWTQPVTHPPPGYAARVTGGVMLPVLTIMSALWFAAMATAAYVVWNSWYQAGFSWPQGPWHGDAEFPRWVALLVIIAVYALLAIPIGAGRRAALYYANGGRMHGWADAWSGLLWIAIVAVLLLGAWYVLPELQDLLRHHLHWPAEISVRAIQI